MTAMSITELFLPRVETEGADLYDVLHSRWRCGFSFGDSKWWLKTQRRLP